MPTQINLPLYGVQTLAPTTDETYIYSFNKGTNLATNNSVHILVDASNYGGVNPITIVLPRISQFSLTWNIVINVVDISNTASVTNIVVVPSGSDKINGDPNFTLNRDGNTLSFMIASQNLWFCEDSSGGGGGPTGVDLELNNTPLAGGPYTTLNFLPSGLTGMSLSNLGGGTAGINIVTAALIKLYYADFLNLVALGQLTIGASYWIVDVGDGQNSQGGLFPADCSAAYYAQPYPSAGFNAFPHNAGIILRAITVNSCDVNAIYLARTVKRPAVPLFQQNLIPYNIGDIVENYNMVFEKTGGGAGVTYNVEAAASTDWTFIPKNNNTYYEIDIQGCIYDYNNNFITKRWDKYANTLENLNNGGSNTNNFIKKCFRWSYVEYRGNHICFDDDSSKDTTLMAPLFNQSLVNYSNALAFTNNTIDTDASNSLVPTTNTMLTRYWNNQLYSSEFSGNNIQRSIVSNIVDGGGNIIVNNNTIKDSVVNNVFFEFFRDNTIINNSMVGDLAGGSQNLASTNLYDITTIPNGAIIFNLGGKQWNTVTAGATLASVTLPSTIDFGTAVFTPTLRPNDIIFFVSGPTAELQGTYRVVASNASNTIFTLVDTLSTAAVNQACTAICYPPSVPTRFTLFNYNIIDSTTVRGMNKVIVTPAYFTKNKLTNCFIENYINHAQPPNGPFLFNYYDGSTTVPQQTEFGAGVNSKEGFTNNKCVDLILTNNRISKFTTNTINGTWIYNNAPTYNTLTFTGTVACGITGNFSANKITGNASFNTDGVTSAYSLFWNVQRLPYSPSVLLNQNSITGDFTLNTFDDGAVFNSCRVAGSFNGNKVLGTAGTPPNPSNGATGFINCLVSATIIVQGITLDGRSSMVGVSFANALAKEVGYTGPSFIDNMLFRDATIAYLNYPNTIPVTPNLFASQNNPIRDIVINAEIPAGTVALGTPVKNYAVADYDVTITTQQPHLLNASQVGVSGQQVFIEGLQFLTVNQTGVVPPQSFFSYLVYNPTIPALNGAFVVPSITITAIIDSYTFQATIASALGGASGFLLSSANAVAADIVNPVPQFSTGSTLPPAVAGLDYYPNAFTAANPPACFNDNLRDNFVSNFSSYPTRMETGSGQGSSFGTTVSLPNSDAKIKVALDLPAGPPPAYPLVGSVGSRSFYHFVNYVTGTTPFYDSATDTLTLPAYLDQMNITIICGSSTGGAFGIERITNLGNTVLNGTTITILSTEGTTVRLALTDPTVFITNTILRQDPLVTTIDINAYTSGVGANLRSTSDKVVLQRVNNAWIIVEQSIAG